MLSKLLARWPAVIALFLLTPAARADWELNMPVGVTPTSENLYDLHMLILWICVVIGILVFGVMIYSMIYHRKSRGAVPAQFHESTAVELAWTLVPLLILIAMAVPATSTLIAMEQTEDAEITIKVTGYQWKWKYDYLNEDISFFSTLSTPREELYDLKEKNPNYLLEVDNHMVVPVDTKIRILLTAADVLHAWWVPELGLKRDAIPGFINDNWTLIKEPGIYRGQCAELCGKDHGFMPVVVEAVSREEYDAWVAGQKGEPLQVAAAENTGTQADTPALDAAANDSALAVEIAANEPVAADASGTEVGAAEAGGTLSMDDLMTKGEQIYGQHCVSCHQANGAGVPPTFPALNGSAVATGPVEDHINIILNGKEGTAMVAYAAQLSDEDIAAVTTYERNAWDNQVGDQVQAADVAALR